ncbi:hypothetical protein KCP77_19325 [Salmonella enterica subsp. enterica]|nr:hypothetical protein KCP77_19325 [Salmonella enterica subsp. enterica]
MYIWIPYLDEGRKRRDTGLRLRWQNIVTTKGWPCGVSSKSGAKPNVITGLIAIA